MVNTLPVIGRNGWLKFGTEVVGYIKGFTVGIKRSLIKEYQYQSGEPCLLDTGNISYPFTADMIWITSTYAAMVLAGTKLTIEIAPENSTPAGQTKITLTEVIFNDWTLTSTQNGAVLEKVAGEAKALAFGSY